MRQNTEIGTPLAQNVTIGRGMKLKCGVAICLLLISSAGVQLHAQWTDEQRKHFNGFKEKAEMGDPEAQCQYARYYDGITNNPVEAAKWYRRAAEQGFGAGQLVLGYCYQSGVGVPKDYVEAYKWLNLSLASKTGYDFLMAKKNLALLEQQMTPEQLLEAQRLSHEFNPHKEASSANPTSPETPTASGTGFFITEDGYLITNEHVVENAKQIRLVTGAGVVAAKFVKVDAANDLALLKAEGRFAPLGIVSSRAARLGNSVATVGFPNIGLQGFAPKLAKGEIAALSGAQDDSRYFQISVAVQPGNSGGALVDERGNVLGVVSAKLNAAAAVATSGVLPENVNYAVKSSFLLSFLESVPDVSAKLKNPNTKEQKFEDVAKTAENAAVLVLVY